MHYLKPFAIAVMNGEITVQCWFPKWFWMVGQLIQNLVWIFPNGRSANTKPCLDTSKWWINGPSKAIWMDLNGSTACYQHCSNGITMCVQNQWAFLKVEILNGFKWSISRGGLNEQIIRYLTWTDIITDVLWMYSNRTVSTNCTVWIYFLYISVEDQTCLSFSALLRVGIDYCLIGYWCIVQ